MSRNSRILVAAFTMIALFAVVVLAAGLPGLQATPSRAPVTIPPPFVDASPGKPNPVPKPEILLPQSSFPLIVLAIALLIVIVFMITTSAGRKMLMYTVVALLVVAVLLLLREQAATPARPTPTPDQESTDVSAAPPSLDFEPPPWLILGASLSVALALVGAVAFASIRLRNRERSPAWPSPLPELADEARQALADLRSGLALRETIIRCYDEMSRTLQEHRGIQRSPATTPQEFARLLAATNLPHADIWRITQLFERARYGQHPLGQEEEDEAIVCLSTIVQACEEQP